MGEHINNPEDLSIQALIAGDRAEFARMVEVFSSRIYRLALRTVGDPQDAEDVLQETFLKANRGLANFEARSSLSTWLYKIAVNEALMILRKRKPDLRIDEEPSEEADEDPVLQLEDWCCRPETEFVNQEARSFLETSIRALPPTLKTVFQLRDIDGLSIKETAEILGISETNVKVRLMRARMKLRNSLSEYFS